LSVNEKDSLPFLQYTTVDKIASKNFHQNALKFYHLTISTALLLRKSIQKEINNILLSNMWQKISNCVVSVLGLEAKFSRHLARVDVYSIGEKHEI